MSSNHSPDPDDVEARRPDYLPGSRVAPDGRRFPWGPIDAIHTVGNIQVVQYRLDQSSHSASQPEAWEEHGQARFHPYIDRVSTSRSYATLDSAVVGAIAYKREGPNSLAAEYFDRMTRATP